MKATDLIDNDQLRDDVPDFAPGDEVKVHVRVVEGSKERVQVFQGNVIARQGGGLQETYTVRKLSYGVGVERTFPLHTPTVTKIEVVKRGDVRRAKLYYLRGRTGKAAKIREKRKLLIRRCRLSGPNSVFSFDIDEESAHRARPMQISGGARWSRRTSPSGSVARSWRPSGTSGMATTSWHRNWRCAIGEIDLIVRRGRTLVVCEVKARKSDAFGVPALAVGAAKQQRLRRLAAAWLADNRVGRRCGRPLRRRGDHRRDDRRVRERLLSTGERHPAIAHTTRPTATSRQTTTST